MKPGQMKLIPVIILLFAMKVTAEEPTKRFQVVVDRMVEAINRQDYPRIQQDFGKIMLDALPLRKSGREWKDPQKRRKKERGLLRFRSEGPGSG